MILLVYGYQGLVAGFAGTALPNWAAGSGVPLAAIGGFLALAGIPWTLQPLWGPVVDRFGGFRAGRRRFWVLGGMAGALASLALLAALAATGEASLPRLGLLLLAHNAFAALVDTAMDGQIIDHVPRDRLGQATALTRTGFATGTAAGAATFAWAIPALGLDGAALLLLGLAALAALAPLAVREAPDDALLSLALRPGAAVAEATLGRMLAGLWAELRRPASLALIALCLAVESSVAAFGLRLSVGLVQETGWTAEEVSRLQAVLVLLGGTVGALAVAAWVDRAGPLRAVTALLLLTAGCHAAASGLLLLPGGGGWEGGAALALSALSPALFFVALAPAVMLASRGAAAATRFTLFMAALNLGGIAGAAASGPLGGVLETWELGLAAAAVLAGCAWATGRTGVVGGSEALSKPS